MADTYIPSPSEHAASQVAQYEASDGREGNELEGRPCIILHTIGRKTGAVRKTPLMRVERAGSYAVVASMGGAPKHPVWYLNILAHPDVELQDGPAPRQYRAHVAEGNERAEWWAIATKTWPAYDDYVTRTDRVIPVVVLEPIE
jgi:deazaflavin-dependent oxidoreductase (nitroreductase family)